VLTAVSNCVHVVAREPELVAAFKNATATIQIVPCLARSGIRG